MKICINACYGGFSLNEEDKNNLPIEKREFDYFSILDGHGNRDDEDLIRLVSENKVAEKKYTRLVIVDIPDESTDWMIREYDGMEELFFVSGGKIHRI